MTYEQCRDTKCAHNRVMERERTIYMKSLKSKCRTKKNMKNPSMDEIRAYMKCAVKHYDGSRLKTMDEKQTKCLKKNCDHLIRIGGGCGGGGRRRGSIKQRKSTRVRA